MVLCKPVCKYTRSDIVAEQQADIDELVDCLEQFMDDLSGGKMKFPNVGVCQQAWEWGEKLLSKHGKVSE